MTTQDPVENEAVVEFKHVTLNYGYEDVIRDVSFSIKRGETKVFLGPSGVGKSTILKGILGLLKPKSGNILIHGSDISNLAEKYLLRFRIKMAMVFQGGALFDSMTVSDNVSYRLRELNLAPEEEIENRVDEVLKFVGLQGAKKLYPAQLSGGMKKRVAIARALAPNPGLFLFDEPTAGLDPINMHNTEQLILKLKEKRKSSIVIVTHDVESALLVADSVVMLHEGKFIFEGTPEEIKSCHDKRVHAFLNPRETDHLIN